MRIGLKKTRFGMLASVLLVAALLFTALPTPVMAVYPTPVGGAVTLDGAPAPVGTVVEVYVGGVLNDTVITDIVGEYNLFNDGSSSIYGQVMTFTVDGYEATSDPAAPVFDLIPKNVDLTATSGPPPPEPPVVDFSASTTAGDAPLAVTFTDLTTGGTPPYTYAWDFDNDTVIDSTSVSPSHTYTIPGTYTVSLAVTDATPLSDTEVKANYITVTAPPVPPGTFTRALGYGWNVMSTPVLLDEDLNTLADILDPADWDVAYEWNSSRQRWDMFNADDELLPLNGIYVYVNNSSGTTATFEASIEISGPPMRELKTEWNLIGPAPALEGASFPGIAVDEALTSLEITDKGPAEGTGYSTVVSPGLNQPSWSSSYTYPLGSGITTNDVLPFCGYWVYMQNKDDLVGSSTTPVTAVPED